MGLVEAVSVPLEEDQIEDMAPILEKLVDASRAGRPGLVFAQILSTEMRVFYLDRERAMEVQRLMGIRPGMTRGDIDVETLEPAEGGPF